MIKVLLTGGGTPQPGDPLYEISSGIPKALLDIAGKPMIQWVLDALNGCSQIEEIALIGLDASHRILCSHPLSYLESTGDLYSNIVKGFEFFAQRGNLEEPVLVVASDIPAVTTEIINWLIEAVRQVDAEVYYPVITREVMEAQFPGSNRTYLHTKDVDICGGDILAIRVELVNRQSGVWRNLGAARKSPVKQAVLLGLDTLFLLLTRRITLADAEGRISSRLGVKGKVIPCPYAAVGMDIDKPHQFDLMQEYLINTKAEHASSH